MKILVISNMMPSEARPSFGIFVQRRIDSYRRLGADVAVVANTDPAKSGLRVIGKYTKLLVGALLRAIRSRPDVIEAHYLFPTAVVGALVSTLLRTPLVLVAHGSDVALDYPKAIGRLVQWAVRRSSAVITNSEATLHLVEIRYPGAKVSVIPPGVAVVPSTPTSRDHAPTVGFVGTLADHKGPDVLIEALSQLPPTTELVVAGAGPERDVLRGLAESLGLAGRVTFLGEVAPDQLNDLYRSFDVLAVPSRREGFGLVAAEALAMGVPVVVSDVGGLPSIPTPDCGTVVPADDVPALARALSDWLSRRGSPDVAARCRARAASFDETELATRSLALLESVVHR